MVRVTGGLCLIVGAAMLCSSPVAGAVETPFATGQQPSRNAFIAADPAFQEALRHSIVAATSHGRDKSAPASSLVDAAEVFGTDDYPPAALRTEQQGRVAVILTVDTKGSVVDCRVDLSSGSPVLDQGTCDLAKTKMHYKPASDQRGRPITGSVPLSIRWILPEHDGHLWVLQTVSMTLERTVDADGKVIGCRNFHDGQLDREQPSDRNCRMDPRELADIKEHAANTLRFPLTVVSETRSEFDGQTASSGTVFQGTTPLNRLTVLFAVAADGQVSNYRVEGVDYPDAILHQISPCDGTTYVLPTEPGKEAVPPGRTINGRMVLTTALRPTADVGHPGAAPKG